MSKPTLNVVEEIRKREIGMAARRESESRLSTANIRLLSWCRPIPQETGLIYIRTLYRPVARIFILTEAKWT